MQTAFNVVPFLVNEASDVCYASGLSGASRANFEQKPLLAEIKPIVVRMLVWSGYAATSLSCTRLLAGWANSLWLGRPLLVSQLGQLSHPFLYSGVGK